MLAKSYIIVRNFQALFAFDNYIILKQPKIDVISSLTHGGHVFPHPSDFNMLSKSSHVAGDAEHVATQFLAFFWQSVLIEFP